VEIRAYWNWEEIFSTWRTCTVGITKLRARRFVSLTFAPEDNELHVQFCQQMLVHQMILHGMLISDKAQFNYDRLNNIHEILTCGRPTTLNGLLKDSSNIDSY
jgi:hypothetical protein